MSNSNGTPGHFTLSAGGLFRLLQRWIRGPESPDFPIPTQILIAIALLWLPLILLSLFEGSLSGANVAQPLISDMVPHVRLLIAIPLLLMAGVVIDPVTRSATVYLETSGVIPGKGLPRYRTALTKLHDARDSLWPDVVIVLLAFGFIWLFKPGYGDSAVKAAATSWMWAVKDGGVDYTAAGWWYLLISGPMFQVILFRWFWRFAIWTGFLYRVSRIPLALQPAHPDHAGGIGYLGMAQQSFAAVFVAFGTVASSSIAYDILSEGSTFRGERLEIVALVVIFMLVIYAPLLFFARQMLLARRAGLEAYGSLGYQLTKAFHEKWVEERSETSGTNLRDSTDSSAMADYTATFDNVRSMRLVPTSFRRLMVVAVILLVPFLPLMFTEYSIQDLMNRLTDVLV